MIALRDMLDGNENQLKLQRLYENYKNTMFSVAYDILKNPHDAEDVVANSLLKVINILDKIDMEDIDKPRGKNLIITITKNAAIDYFRKMRKAPEPCEYIEDNTSGKDIEEMYIETENYKVFLDK